MWGKRKKGEGGKNGGVHPLKADDNTSIMRKLHTQPAPSTPATSRPPPHSTLRQLGKYPAQHHPSLRLQQSSQHRPHNGPPDPIPRWDKLTQQAFPIMMFRVMFFSDLPFNRVLN
ncbi:hypothetical protein CHARACLAT_013976 [Characodon lateralis]|uniref:Uncharacterized protein n=1 Tax=Characodon lateralis TaxID=208331 RepID=A0ABU7DJG3_9TELE|nr:hypothetical protein [Characodon lateralis]